MEQEIKSFDEMDLSNYNDIHKVMRGMALLGTAAKVFMGEPSQENMFSLMLLIENKRNVEQARVAAYCFHRENIRIVQTDEEAIQAWDLFTPMQNNLRKRLQDEIDASEQRRIRREYEQERQKREQSLRIAIEESKEAQKPHEMGTVAEIAAKYGISKSEVRRRKAVGTLHELVSQTN